jgi:hypothetical protein
MNQALREVAAEIDWETDKGSEQESVKASDFRGFGDGDGIGQTR